MKSKLPYGVTEVSAQELKPIFKSNWPNPGPFSDFEMIGKSQQENKIRIMSGSRFKTESLSRSWYSTN